MSFKSPEKELQKILEELEITNGIDPFDYESLEKHQDLIFEVVKNSPVVRYDKSLF